MNKPQTFEQFLQDKHAEDYHGTDDDMPDAFVNWLVDLQVDDLIDYGQEAIEKARLEGKEEVMGKIAPNVLRLKELLANL